MINSTIKTNKKTKNQTQSNRNDKKTITRKKTTEKNILCDAVVIDSCAY